MLGATWNQTAPYNDLSPYNYFCGCMATAAGQELRYWRWPYRCENFRTTSVVLSDEQLLEYLDSIEKKTLDYLDTLTDEMLYECPENCRFTRMELVLRQYRHLSFHTGMLNGQVAVNTGRFPMWVSDADKYVDDGIFFGRYRKGQTKI